MGKVTQQRRHSIAETQDPALSAHARGLPLSSPNWGKGGPERAGYLPKVTQETVAEDSRPPRVSVADPLLPRSGPLQSAALRAGARASPGCRSVSLSVWVSPRAQRCPPPQARAFAAPGPRPTPHAPRPQPTDRSACARARAPHPKPVRGSRRGKVAAACRRRDLCSLARSLLSGEAKPGSPGNPPSKMKKLQGAHQRKVGQEDGGAHGDGGTPDLGVQRPAPSRPREGRRGHLDRLGLLGRPG